MNKFTEVVVLVVGIFFMFLFVSGLWVDLMIVFSNKLYDIKQKRRMKTRKSNGHGFNS